MTDNYFMAQYRYVPALDREMLKRALAEVGPGAFDYVTPAMDGDSLLFIKNISVFDGLNVVWSWLEMENHTMVYIGKDPTHRDGGMINGQVLYSGCWRDDNAGFSDYPVPGTFQLAVVNLIAQKAREMAAVYQDGLPDLGTEIEEAE